MLTIYTNMSPKLQQNVDKIFIDFSVNHIPDIFSKVDFSQVNEPAVEWYLLISFYILKRSSYLNPKLRNKTSRT